MGGLVFCTLSALPGFIIVAYWLLVNRQFATYGDFFMVDKIRFLCEKNNTNIKALERELGLGNGTIRRWDERSPSIDKVVLVANHFGVPISALLDDEKSPTSGEIGPSKQDLLNLIDTMEMSELAEVMQKLAETIQKRAKGRD